MFFKNSIYTRLSTLGYGEEDFDHTLDKKGWNWRGMFMNSRPLTEKGKSLNFSKLSISFPDVRRCRMEGNRTQAR